MYRSAVGAPILLFALSGLIGHGAWLLSQGYTHYVRGSLAHHAIDVSTLTASSLAVRLSPFSHRELARHGLVLARHRMQDGAIAAYQLALERAPADPFLWQSLIRHKSTSAQFDAEYSSALQRVHALAPAEISLHRENSVIALRNWHLADAGIQELWMADIGKVVRYDRKWLLNWVLGSRSADTFCNSLNHQEVAIQNWCVLALNARQVCFSLPRTRRAARWCQRYGLVQDKQE